MAPFCLRGRFGNNKRFKQRKNIKKMCAMERMQERLGRLKARMEEISEEQKIIRDGQRQIRENFEAIKSECEGLKRETRFIIQQSARSKIKMALMFGILKAREEGNIAGAANLTQFLREIVRLENEGNEASDDN